MKETRAAVLVTLVVLALGTSTVSAQVESHVLPDSLPVLLLPPYVMELPKPNSTELSAPLLHEKLAAETVSGPKPGVASSMLGIDGPKETGRPGATTLGEMLSKFKKPVELALIEDWEGAAKAGDPLLTEPRDTCEDFTWDYLGNAVAWSYVKLGKLDEAAKAHRNVASRINDPAVRKYHLLAAGVLDPASAGENAPALAELQKPDVYKTELKKKLLPDAKKFEGVLERAAKADNADAAAASLKMAYEIARLVYAVDAETGKDFLKKFRPAADTLVTDGGTKLLAAVRKQHDKMASLESMAFTPSRVNEWNAPLKQLWAGITQVKRVARIHDYLRRLGLTDVADPKPLFDDAHQLLFAAGSTTMVYKIMGTRSAAGLDMKRRAPYTDSSGDFGD